MTSPNTPSLTMTIKSGQCFRTGLNDDTGGATVPLDYIESLKWNQLAAEQGYGPAQFNLGIAYVRGMGTKQDFSAAKEWFRKACKNNVHQGCAAYEDLENKGY